MKKVMLKPALNATACISLLLVSFTGCGQQGAEHDLHPFSTQLHLHGSGSEANGSIRAANRRAAELGIDVLFWTDHDFRVSFWSYVNGYDFEGNDDNLIQVRNLSQVTGNSENAHEKIEFSLKPDEGNGDFQDITARLSPTISSQGKRSFQLSARDNGREYEALYYNFDVTRRRAKGSLAANIRLRFSVYPQVDQGVLPTVRVKLSQHFDDYMIQELRYVLWNGPIKNLPVTAEAHVSYIPLSYTPEQWNTFEVNLSEDAEKYNRGGRDNALNSVGFGLELARGSGTVYFDDYQILREVKADQLRTKMHELGRMYGAEFGVVNHMGQEISFGQHLNTWGSWVPMIDYSKHPTGMTYEETVDYVHSHNGLAAINHYLWREPVRLARGNDPVAEDDWYTKTIGELVESGCWGADMFELPSGTDQAKIKGYLRVWDSLNAAGLYITGHGVSDGHNSSEDGWHTGGNFVTWILARSKSEQDLMEGLRLGRAYFGDPAQFRGELEFRTGEGHTMGQVVATTSEEETVRIKLTELPLNSVVNVIINGAVFEKYDAREPTLNKVLTIPTSQRTFVRLGVWTEGGRGILFTNPIYFVPPGDVGNIPSHRLIMAD
ncbi:CehA/McbA family metallohydrolase [candidate division KSB1 bacterium]